MKKKSFADKLNDNWFMIHIATIAICSTFVMVYKIVEFIF